MNRKAGYNAVMKVAGLAFEKTAAARWSEHMRSLVDKPTELRKFMRSMGAVNHSERGQTLELKKMIRATGGGHLGPEWGEAPWSSDQIDDAIRSVREQINYDQKPFEGPNAVSIEFARKYPELKNTERIPFYHGTSRENAEGIVRHGPVATGNHPVPTPSGKRQRRGLYAFAPGVEANQYSTLDEGESIEGALLYARQAIGYEPAAARQQAVVRGTFPRGLLEHLTRGDEQFIPADLWRHVEDLRVLGPGDVDDF